MKSVYLAIACLALLLVPGYSRADIVLTYAEDFTLDGNNYDRNDLARIQGGSNSLYFDNSAITGGVDRITGFHDLSPDEVLFTSVGDFSIGSESYQRGDIVQYDRISGNSTLVFDSAVLSNTNVTSLSRFQNGDLAFSVNSAFTIGATNYDRGDIVRYDTTNDTHSLWFDSASITRNSDGDVEALHVLDDTNMIFAHNRNITLGGIDFRRGDLINYNTATGIASLNTSRDLLASNTNRVTAFSNTAVPEPQHLVVVAGVLFVSTLILRRNRKSNHKLTELSQSAKASC